MGRARVIERGDQRLIAAVRDGAIWSLTASEPHVAYAAAVAGQVRERVQSIKMLDRQIRNGLGRRESHIDGHAPAAVLLETQASPAELGAGI